MDYIVDCRNPLDWVFVTSGDILRMMQGSHGYCVLLIDLIHGLLKRTSSDVLY